MIPTVIVFGILVGLLPRYRLWAVPLGAVLWSILLSIEGDPSMSTAEIWTAGLALGAVNAAAGVALGWGLATAAPATLRRFRRVVR